jgi:Holliday junction resolvase RusA-like endonuclease
MNKKSIGKSATNNGKVTELTESVFEIDLNRKCHIIDVIPIGAVRMTKSDRWKINPNHIDPRKRQRPAVTRYFDFKNKVVKECNKVGYVMKNHIDVVFFLPMPDSWSTKKKELYNGKPHKSRPDIDNIVKGLMDAVKKEDGDVWSVKAEKRYAYKGSILIYE